MTDAASIPEAQLLLQSLRLKIIVEVNSRRIFAGCPHVRHRNIVRAQTGPEADFTPCKLRSMEEIPNNVMIKQLSAHGPDLVRNLGLVCRPRCLSLQQCLYRQFSGVVTIVWHPCCYLAHIASRFITNCELPTFSVWPAQAFGS